MGVWWACPSLGQVDVAVRHSWDPRETAACSEPDADRFAVGWEMRSADLVCAPC